MREIFCAIKKGISMYVLLIKIIFELKFKIMQILMLSELRDIK